MNETLILEKPQNTMSFSQEHRNLFGPKKLIKRNQPDPLKNSSFEDLLQLFRDLLNEGLHGLCFSAYEEGQQPTDILTREQIARRMAIMAPHTKWTRTFSCIEGNELIPQVAKEYGINTMVGAWLSDDLEKNEQEIEALITLAQEGFVDVAAVGNEVLLREELTEDQIIDYIRRVQEACPGVPVGYVDAYYEFNLNPRIAEASDVIMINCYPFWEGTHIDDAHAHLQSMYDQARAVANGKRVIISETGWPSQGSNFEASEPSMENFMRYFINTQRWVKSEEIETLYFTSFDESWKVGNEGDVGAYWGIWDKIETLKV